MSIYATLWEIKVPARHWADDEYVGICAQGVPPHIGHPSQYPEGDPYAEFLPPVVQDYDPNDLERHTYYRAVVIIKEGQEAKEGQRYVAPLFTMTGEEYAKTSFQDLIDRIHKAVWDDTIISVYQYRLGPKVIVRRGEPFPFGERK